MKPSGTLSFPEEPQAPAAARLVGVWAGLFTALWIVVFNVMVVLGALGLPTRLAAVVASLLIALFFLPFVSAIHRISVESLRVWTQISLSFAIIYGTLAVFNYFLQLTVVRQDPAAYAWLTMQFTPGTAFWALEVLLYTLQGLSAALLMPVFARAKYGRLIQWLLIANAAFTVLGALAYTVTGNPQHALVFASLGVYAVALPAALILCALSLRAGLPPRPTE